MEKIFIVDVREKSGRGLNMAGRPRESRRGHQTQETSIVKVDDLYEKGGRSPAPGKDLG